MVQIQRKYPDSIETSEGKIVRLSELNPEKIIHIGHTRTPIKVKDVPLTAVLLSCGDMVRGIAFSPGDLIFCEKHHDEIIVEEILSS